MSGQPQPQFVNDSGVPQVQLPAWPSERDLGSRGARLGARLLDLLLQLVAYIVLVMLVSLAHASGSAALSVAGILVGIAGFIAIVLYEPWMIWHYGATLGKRICRLRVVRLEVGQSLSGGQAFGRWGAAIGMGFVPFGGLLNVLWCCWDRPWRQCLHDKAAGSVVVKA